MAGENLIEPSLYSPPKPHRPPHSLATRSVLRGVPDLTLPYLTLPYLTLPYLTF